MMNFGSMFGPMAGIGDFERKQLSPMAGIGGFEQRQVAALPKPNPIPSQIGSMIGGIFGGSKPAAPNIGTAIGMGAKPMQLPNYGGMSRPTPMAKPIAGMTPVSQGQGAPQWGHAGWLARGKKAR